MNESVSGCVFYMLAQHLSGAGGSVLVSMRRGHQMKSLLSTIRFLLSAKNHKCPVQCCFIHKCISLYNITQYIKRNMNKCTLERADQNLTTVALEQLNIRDKGLIVMMN